MQPATVSAVAGSVLQWLTCGVGRTAAPKATAASSQPASFADTRWRNRPVKIYSSLLAALRMLRSLPKRAVDNRLSKAGSPTVSSRRFSMGTVPVGFKRATTIKRPRIPTSGTCGRNSRMSDWRQDAVEEVFDSLEGVGIGAIAKHLEDVCRGLESSIDGTADRIEWMRRLRTLFVAVEFAAIARFKRKGELKLDVGVLPRLTGYDPRWGSKDAEG